MIKMVFRTLSGGTSHLFLNLWFPIAMRNNNLGSRIK